MVNCDKHYDYCTSCTYHVNYTCGKTNCNNCPNLGENGCRCLEEADDNATECPYYKEE